MKMAKQKNYLTFVLYNGSNYEETNEYKYRDTTRQLQKIDFHKQEMIIPLENYSFQKSDSSRFNDQVKSMNLAQLEYSQDSIGKLSLEGKTRNLNQMRNARTLRYNGELDTTSRVKRKTPFALEGIGKWKNIQDEIEALTKAQKNAEEIQHTLENFSRERYHHTYTLRLIDIAIFDKFALSIACLNISAASGSDAISGGVTYSNSSIFTYL